MKITQSYEEITGSFQACLRNLAKQDDIWIGLPGGTSLDRWYEYLISHPHIWEKIDMKKLRFALVDERCLPKGDKDRNDSHVQEVFIGPLMKGGMLEPSQFISSRDLVDAEKYGQDVQCFDIACFGMGPDGHIASLFPNHPALHSSKEGFVEVHNAPKPPGERISLSPQSIRSIPYTYLFVVGPSKQDAYKNFLDPCMSSQECPAKLLSPEVILVDM